MESQACKIPMSVICLFRLYPILLESLYEFHLAEEQDDKFFPIALQSLGFLWFLKFVSNRICHNVNVLKFLTHHFLYSKKKWVIRPGIHKMSE